MKIVKYFGNNKYLIKCDCGFIFKYSGFKWIVACNKCKRKTNMANIFYGGKRNA